MGLTLWNRLTGNKDAITDEVLITPPNIEQLTDIPAGFKVMMANPAYNPTDPNTAYKLVDSVAFASNGPNSAGNTITGVGTPNNSVGENGYYYIQLDAATGANNLWGPKASGAWPAQADNNVGSGSSGSTPPVAPQFTAAINLTGSTTPAVNNIYQFPLPTFSAGTLPITKISFEILANSNPIALGEFRDITWNGTDYIDNENGGAVIASSAMLEYTLTQDVVDLNLTSLNIKAWAENSAGKVEISGDSPVTFTGGGANVPPQITTPPVLAVQAPSNAMVTGLYTITPPVTTGTPTPANSYRWKVGGVLMGAPFTALSGPFLFGGADVKVEVVASNGEAPDATADSNSLAIDEYLNPVSILNKTYAGYSFDRVIDGYTGNTVKLSKAPYGAGNEQDFGTKVNGEFDIAAVDTWRAGADVKALGFYEQFGPTAGTALYLFSGDAMVVESDVYNRFATDWSTTDETLTRSTTQGGIGVRLVGNAHIVTDDLVADVAANGIEIFALWSPDRFKNRANNIANGEGGSNETENLFGYGDGTNNYIRYWLQGASNGVSTQFKTGGSTNQQICGANFQRFKQYGQHIVNASVTPTGFMTSVNDYDGQPAEKAHTTAASTALAGGSLNNGKFVFGTRFNNTAGTAFATGDRTHGIYNGAILTHGLTDAERAQVRANLGQIGQQHCNKSEDWVKEQFDDIVRAKDIAAGAVTGIKGQVTFNFNTNGDIIFNKDSEAGFKCFDCPTNNANNTWVASNNFFAGITTGTTLSMHRHVRNTVPADALMFPLVQDIGTTGSGSDLGEVSLGLCYDHTAINMLSKMPESRDTDTVTGNRKLKNGNPIGDNAGSGAANQAKGKYNRNTNHGKFTYNDGTTKSPNNSNGSLPDMSGYNTPAAWNNTDPAITGNDQIDAPSGHDIPANIQFAYKERGLVTQIGTFEAPPGYDRSAPYATKKPMLLNAKNRSYIGIIGSSLGHVYGDTAINNNAAVCDSDDNSRLQSSKAFNGMEGEIMLWGFKAGVAHDRATAEMIQSNIHKVA